MALSRLSSCDYRKADVLWFARALRSPDTPACTDESVGGPVDSVVSKTECLDRMIPLREVHLRRTIAEFVAHHHSERNRRRRAITAATLVYSHSLRSGPGSGSSVRLPELASRSPHWTNHRGRPRECARSFRHGCSARPTLAPIPGQLRAFQAWPRSSRAQRQYSNCPFSVGPPPAH